MNNDTVKIKLNATERQIGLLAECIHELYRKREQMKPEEYFVLKSKYHSILDGLIEEKTRYERFL